MISLEYNYQYSREAHLEMKRAMRQVDNRVKDAVDEILRAILVHTRPYVPVDTSELINSEFMDTWTSRRGRHYGTVGYAALHAMEVHEGGPRNWQKPGASDAFLWYGVIDMRRQSLPAIVQKYGVEDG